MDGHSLGKRRLRASRLLPFLTSGPPPRQVHCISTEFTPRKHGGEKGVPFRVQIDTFKQNENGEYTEHLHSASCQIKVFKVGCITQPTLVNPACQMALCCCPECRPGWVCGLLHFFLDSNSWIWACPCPAFSVLKSVGRDVSSIQGSAFVRMTDLASF